MGEAKRRGDYEQRRQQAVTRRAEAIEAKRVADQQWWEGLTDEEREEEIRRVELAEQRRHKFLSLMTAAAAVRSHGPYFR